jgi:acyl-coenzyme A synthetase/AMP-(fatty) acid ligase
MKDITTRSFFALSASALQLSADSLWDAFRAAANHHSSRPAVSMAADVWSYGQLFTEADAIRRWIRSEVTGGPILFVPKNTQRSLAFLLGSIGSQRVPLFADPAWTGPELEGVIQRCGVSAAAWEGSPPAGMRCLTDESERGGIALFKVASSARNSNAVALRDDVAFGRFTSGTTGFSRCLQFRDQATLAATAGWCQATGMSFRDRVLCLATLNNGLAFNTSIFTILLSGGLLAFHQGMLLRGSLSKTLATVEPTILVSFPFVYELLFGANDCITQARTLRLAVSSAAPLSREVRLRWKKGTGLGICDYYGLAEVGPCTFNDGSVPNSVGVALPGVSFVITGRKGQQFDAGQTGQIRVKTNSMASDYLDNLQPRFSSNLDRQGYFITSDLGLITPDMRLLLQGRVGRIVNVAGRKIDPAEVETVIRQIPGVSDVMVRGENDLNRVYLAAYVESSTVLREDIVAFCAGRMAQYKIPQRIAILQALPRSSSGKISMGRMIENDRSLQ